MKKTFLTVMLIGGSVFQSFSQEYQVVWADEFNGTTVDLSKWSFMEGNGSDYGLPGGWGNNELQYYRPENAVVAGGNLTITAKQEQFNGYNYTSSRLRSLGKGDWTYGRFEMRAKMPVGRGLWPAFWMLATDPSIYGGWAASGEIDIMEYLGSEPNKVLGTIHYGSTWPGNTYSSSNYTLPSGNFNEGFHVFAVEWEPSEIRWYMDDVLFATKNNWFSTGGPYPAPFDVDFHLLLNMAVGGNLPGSPDSNTVFPQEYVIDYVRVLQKPNTAPTIAIANPSDGANIPEGDNLTIIANVNDNEKVQKVEFYQGDGKVGEDDTAPYQITITDPSNGCYTLKAIVTDAGGLKTESALVNISVGSSGCLKTPYLMKPASIPGLIEAENYDMGGQNISYSDTDPSNNPGAYRADEGVDIEKTSDTNFGFNVKSVLAGEWLDYTVDVEDSGKYDFEVRVASPAAGGSFTFESAGIAVSDVVNFAGTGGAQKWVNVSAKAVSLKAGVQVVRLAILSGDFSINKINVKKSPSVTPGKEIVFDDMEHGNPLANGWFFFGGSVGGGGINFNTTTPPHNGGNFSIESGWGSGGTPGYFGGFGRTNPIDLSGTTHFNLWINPDLTDGAGRQQNYTLEINLQEDDNGDNNITQAADDEFQYNLTVGPEGSGAKAIAGGGWQLVSIPLSDFFDDNSYLYGGNGTLDAISPEIGGNGQLIGVVIAIISTNGADATFRTDYWNFNSPFNEPKISLFDDFEDGNSADWIFFGGNNAGGGGGVLTDRPKEGANYLSTGWGGQGSASVFYGGFFKNLDDANQLTLPKNPWINLWVLNQSDAKSNSYTLEVTVREDTDGNGYTGGADDSFRFDSKYFKSHFDDRWTLLSAPLDSFINLQTGGDGVFNGKLDEMVIVVSGVQGPDGSTVEVDLDQIIFTNGAPLVRDTIAPVFTSCPVDLGPLPLELNGSCGAVAAWNPPIVTDDLSTVKIAQISGPESGSILPAGSNATVTYQATDHWGNTSDCSFTVKVAASDLTASASATSTVYLGFTPKESVIIGAKGHGGMEPYAYDWGHGPSNNGNFTVSPRSTTTYHVKISDAFGCVAYDSVKVCVVDVRCGKGKVAVCHRNKSLCISEKDVWDHLRHGDKLGACGTSLECGVKSKEEVSTESDNDQLIRSYPNPFSSKTTIEFSLQADSRVIVEVYDQYGQLQEVLMNGQAEAKRYLLTWNPKGKREGVYFCKLRTNKKTYYKKLIYSK